jgi:hypothetical protein
MPALIALLVALQATNVTPAQWNSVPARFLDYLEGPEGEEERQVVAILPGDRRVAVTTGEQEGGAPSLAAIGFANADSDPTKELIVILRWDIRHYDVEGAMYDIRILDDPKPGATALAPVEKAQALFESYACDCNRRDEPPDRAKVKTIAAVKQVLKRAGY